MSLTPYYERDGIQLFHADCLEVLPTLTAESVDLVLTDPPYFQVSKEEWDNQWACQEAYLDWLRSIFREVQNLLKIGGGLYIFAGHKSAAKVECVVGEFSEVLNRIIWRKPSVVTREDKIDKYQLRSFFPVTETIIFAERGSLGAVLKDARQQAGISCKETTGRIGAHGKVNHGGAVSNWELGLNIPSVDQYRKLAAVYSLPPYEKAVRPFCLSRGPHVDVWEFPPATAMGGKSGHPCEKPLGIIEHMMMVSSRNNDTILDPFAGSCTTLLAAWRLGRKCIGVEISEQYCELGAKRIDREISQGQLFAPEPTPAVQTAITFDE